MQFSNTTDKNGLIQRYEDYTNLDDGVVTGDTTLLAKATTDINETVYELITDIMLLQDSFDWDDPYLTDYPIATTPLVAGQRDYQFDNISFLKLKRVDVTYDGTNWNRATPFDSAAYFEGLGNETLVDDQFNTSAPMYDPKTFGFWLYPTATAAQVADGAKARIEFTRAFDEFTTSDTTQEPAIDRPFHELIAMGAALKYLLRKGDPRAANLKALYEEGRNKMVQHYDSRNEDSFLVFSESKLDHYV